MWFIITPISRFWTPPLGWAFFLVFLRHRAAQLTDWKINETEQKNTNRKKKKKNRVDLFKWAAVEISIYWLSHHSNCFNQKNIIRVNLIGVFSLHNIYIFWTFSLSSQLTYNISKNNISTPTQMPAFDESSPAVAQWTKVKTLYQVNLDRVTPFVTYRWITFGALLFLFLLRIVLAQGWYIICYTLAIYLLSLFIQFLQPKFDVSLQQELRDESIEEGLTEEEKASGGVAPNGATDDEFRPFIRRLPEFKFWHKATVATVTSLILSFFEFLDLPVFWPILVVYFIVLFSFSMKKQIQHMVKYHYVPLDIGKTKYNKSTKWENFKATKITTRCLIFEKWQMNMKKVDVNINIKLLACGVVSIWIMYLDSCYSTNVNHCHRWHTELRNKRILFHCYFIYNCFFFHSFLFMFLLFLLLALISFFTVFLLYN